VPLERLTGKKELAETNLKGKETASGTRAKKFSISSTKIKLKNRNRSKRKTNPASRKKVQVNTKSQHLKIITSLTNF